MENSLRAKFYWYHALADGSYHTLIRQKMLAFSSVAASPASYMYCSLDTHGQV